MKMQCFEIGALPVLHEVERVECVPTEVHLDDEEIHVVGQMKLCRVTLRDSDTNNAIKISADRLKIEV